MTIKTDKKSMDELPVTGALVLTGSYAELCDFFDKIERNKPGSIRLIYRRFSPGHLYLKAEGEK